MAGKRAGGGVCFEGAVKGSGGWRVLVGGGGGWAALAGRSGCGSGRGCRHTPSWSPGEPETRELRVER